MLPLLLAGPAPAVAQELVQATDTAVVEPAGSTGLDMDTVAVRDARFNPDAVARLQADPAYDYDRDLRVETLWWDRLLEWLRHKLNELFGTKAGDWVFSHLDWAIMLIGLGLLLFYLRKRLFHGGFSTEPAKPRQVLEIAEDLPRIDLDLLLAQAETEGNWRSALRYQYLKVLRRLMDDGSIRFRPEDTDRDYLRQLKDPAQRSTFAELSFLFKWAWYGDAPMDEAHYRSLAPAFIHFHAAPGKP